MISKTIGFRGTCLFSDTPIFRDVLAMSRCPCPGWFLPDHAPAYAVPSLFSPSVFCPWQSIELSEVMEQRTIHGCHCQFWWNNDHLIMIKYGNHEIIIVPLDYCKWNQMKQLIIWWKSHIWMKKPYDLFILILLITSYYTMLHISRVKTHGEWWSMAQALSMAQNSTAVLSPSQGHPIASNFHRKKPANPRGFV